MKSECYEIGAVQAFLDGELAPEAAETFARHVAACDDCALRLATAEEETALAFGALEKEFSTLVPTARLWTKINDSIEREKKSFWQPIFAFLRQPAAAAFAGLLFVAAVSLALLAIKSDQPTEVAELREPAENSAAIKAIAEPKQTAQIERIESAPAPSAPKKVQVANLNRNENEFRAVKAVRAKPETNRAAPNASAPPKAVVDPTGDEILPDEANYVKTIATLTTAVSSRKDEVLSASARFTFERDLAMTDDAIRQMRREVRSNPRSEAAKQILRVSYQNKIDLLNSLADKTELMASLK